MPRQHTTGGKPTKEAYLHHCLYCEREGANAVVDLHSTHSVAVRILADIDPNDVLPPLTAYYVMRVGKLPLYPIFRPATSTSLALSRPRPGRTMLLLANHGPVVAGTIPAEAQFAIELEETAKLLLMLEGHHRPAHR